MDYLMKKLDEEKDIKNLTKKKEFLNQLDDEFFEKIKPGGDYREMQEFQKYLQDEKFIMELQKDQEIMGLCKKLKELIKKKHDDFIKK